MDKPTEIITEAMRRAIRTEIADAFENFKQNLQARGTIHLDLRNDLLIELDETIMGLRERAESGS